MFTRCVYPFVAILCSFPLGAMADEHGEQLRVFTLQNADCGEMAALLADLADDELRMGVDRRTNSLVIADEEDTLAAIGELLMKLDQKIDRPVAKRQQSNSKDGADARNGGSNAAVIASPVRGRIDQIKVEGSKVKQGEVVARIALENKAQQAESARRRAQRLRAQQLLAERKHSDAETRQKNQVGMLAQRIEFMKRKLAMFDAEAKLQQLVSERELAASKRKLEILEGKERNAKSTGDAGRDIAELRIESELTRAGMEVQEQKLRFFLDHTIPIRRLETEMELAETQLAHTEQQSRVRLQQRATEAAQVVRATMEKERAERAAKGSQVNVIDVVADRDGYVTHVTRLQSGSIVRERQPMIAIRQIPPTH